MTTEHFTLQTARSATIAEANGRCALFMGSVSSAVVALAFIGQASGLSEGFFLFGLVLFPSLLFIGVFTFKRVLQTAVEDIIYARGINRIRHYYIELAPEARRYLIQSIHDDTAGALRGMGIVPTNSKWDMFQTSSGMVAVINSVIGGVFAGLLCRFLFSLPIYADFGLGILFFVVSIYVQRNYIVKKFADLETRLEALFPSNSR
ncbi:MAG TPA: hypothetical protein VF131_04290 [Blastocatellia bacterium]|nr:hypothetical protein [Blastocatellia bacterium]